MHTLNCVFIWSTFTVRHALRLLIFMIENEKIKKNCCIWNANCAIWRAISNKTAMIYIFFALRVFFIFRFMLEHFADFCCAIHYFILFIFNKVCMRSYGNKSCVAAFFSLSFSRLSTDKHKIMNGSESTNLQHYFLRTVLSK